jgi:alkylation response protein AidB-like acyl-CoA dehydrogenase
MEAIADKGEYIISGTKLFVPDAHVSDYLLCATRTQEMTKPDEGITLFLVDTKSPGISCTVLQTIASDKQCEVTFDKVRVPAANMLGGLDDGWRIMERIMQQAVVAQCALMIGGAQQVLEMTVRYAKERVQFDKPIGSFQAIQHKCADMVTDVDGAKLITYEAAWMLSKGMACAKEVSMAKAWVSEAYRRTCVEGLQIHGGIGFTKDCDMQLYFRRGKAQELAFGDADFHQEIVSRRIGL